MSSEEAVQHRVQSTINRRMFLRAGGVAIALPTLVSALPKGSRAQSDAPKRLLTLYHPNGMPISLQQVRDGDTAIPAELLARFSEFHPRMSIASGLNANSHKAKTAQTTSHPHVSCYASLYTGRAINGYGDDEKTFDQHIADDPRHQGSARNSIAINLHMKSDAHLGVPPAYFNAASWRGPNQPVIPMADPRVLFEDLFGRDGGTPISTDPAVEAARQERLLRKQLVLDVMTDQIGDLKRKLGRSDHSRLDEFLTGVEELDRRTQELRETRMELAAQCTGADGPASVTDSVRVPLSIYPETLAVMQDLVVRAFQCDLTRIATFAHCTPAGGAVMRNPFVTGLEGPMSHWHPLSHFFAPYGSMHPDVEVNRRDFTRVISWHYDRMAEFLTKLSTTPGTWGGDSLLDETLVVAGTSMDYPGHNCGAVQQLLFGTANGAFKEGADADNGLDRASGTANLWLTIMRGFGLDNASIGDSNGTMDALLA